ncbi:hypothetical protein SAMCFNEI73_pC1381 (plasmid) [Sinorhizobium americanum]|uniref:Uncharacterized protein n=1 Tax=Sinorhizobium americanum TaxID=194963 RepID=A0A1L3LYH4_9HYPH|nr:hypothetical protein SAMCFNEI73_pC1381 [Sinorhizobium americanum]
MDDCRRHQVRSPVKGTDEDINHELNMVLWVLIENWRQ